MDFPTTNVLFEQQLSLLEKTPLTYQNDKPQLSSVHNALISPPTTAQFAQIDSKLTMVTMPDIGTMPTGLFEMSIPTPPLSTTTSLDRKSENSNPSFAEVHNNPLVFTLGHIPSPPVSNQTSLDRKSMFFDESSVTTILTQNIDPSGGLMPAQFHQQFAVQQYPTTEFVLEGTVRKLQEGVAKPERKRTKSAKSTDGSITKSPPSDKNSALNNDKKKYACTIRGCEKRFATSGHLSRHIRSHDGAKPFQCPTCGAFFSRQDNMLQHQKNHEKKKAALQSRTTSAETSTTPSRRNSKMQVPLPVGGNLPVLTPIAQAPEPVPLLQQPYGVVPQALISDTGISSPISPLTGQINPFNNTPIQMIQSDGQVHTVCMSQQQNQQQIVQHQILIDPNQYTVIQQPANPQFTMQNQLQMIDLNLSQQTGQFNQMQTMNNVPNQVQSFYTINSNNQIIQHQPTLTVNSQYIQNPQFTVNPSLPNTNLTQQYPTDIFQPTQVATTLDNTVVFNGGNAMMTNQPHQFQQNLGQLSGSMTNLALVPIQSNTIVSAGQPIMYTSNEHVSNPMVGDQLTYLTYMN